MFTKLLHCTCSTKCFKAINHLQRKETALIIVDMGPPTKEIGDTTNKKCHSKSKAMAMGSTQAVGDKEANPSKDTNWIRVYS
jgi:hypothetical protein